VLKTTKTRAMKKIHNIIDTIYSKFLFFLVVVMLFSVSPLLGQETSEDKPAETPADTPAEVIPEKKPAKKYARPAFESAWWFDNQTGVVNKKNTLEFVIQHRFSVIGSDAKELLGLYGPSTNTRIGLSYVPIKNLSFGLGYTKLKYVLDFDAKWAFLNQTRDDKTPITLTYYVNMGIEVQDASNYAWGVDRLNYFHELIIMRRFSKKYSLMLSPSYTHYNSAKYFPDDDGVNMNMNNDTWGLSIGMRFKVSSTVVIMAGYDAILTEQPVNQPFPSINLGLEIATSNHAFQILLSNNNRIQPQENFMYNSNDYTSGMWLIGFNITRLRSL
jgi:hypothetical protein